MSVVSTFLESDDPKTPRPPDDLSGGRVVVSLVVILLQFPVDLRGPSHNADAQNIA